MIGQLIDHQFQIEGLLGRGGMGTVYRAIDQTNNRPVALKFLHAYLDSADKLAQKRFQREFRLLSQLDHPRIVQTYGAGHYQHAPYLVMELLTGQPLDAVLTNGPLPRDRLLAIAGQVADALCYLHRQAIVHRDLKPGNLMLLEPLSNGPEIKLLDFGLARSTKLSVQLTQEGVALGTMAYIAPEQAQGFAVDFRADLYALGIIMYEMAAGRPPFIHDNPAVMLMNQLTVAPPSPRQFNPHLDEPLEALIMQLLAKEPAERPHATDQLAARLAELANDTAPLPAPGVYHRVDLIPRVPLVGRAGPLRQFHEQWAAVQQGQGHVFLLRGVAGAGKTRLLDEVSVQARLEGCQLMRGLCREHTALPYQPFRDILEAQLHKMPASQRRQLPPELIRLLPNFKIDDVAVASPRADDQGRLFAACWQVLRQAAQEWPFLLVIEDVQWADPGTLQLLQYLADRIATTSALLVISYRPEELKTNAAAASALESLERLPGATAIPLPLLTREQVAHFLQAALGRPSLPGWLVDSFHAATNGNPLFIEETLKTLAAEGQVADWIGQSSSQWPRTSQPSLSLQLPKTVLALAERRLKLLSTQDRTLLTSAAVLGPEFAFSLLQEVTHQDEDTLLDAIDRLLAAHLIEEFYQDDEDYYRFAQEALRQALLSTVSQRRRRRLHQRSGEAIETKYDTGQARYWPALAYHFAEAGDDHRALKYFILAGDAADQLYAHTEAITHYSQALTLLLNHISGGLTYTHQQQAVHLFTQRGRSFELLGQYPAAQENYLELQKLGQQLPDPGLELAALLALGTIYAAPTKVRNLEQALTVSKEALALAQARQDRPAEAKALWNLMQTYKGLAQPEQAVSCGEKSIAIARTNNLREQLAYATNDISWAYIALGQLTLGEQTLDEAGRLWQELDNRPMLADNRAGATGYYFLRGDFKQATALAHETLQISEAIDNRWNQTQGHMALGHLAMMQGHIQTAIEQLWQAITLSEQGGWITPQVSSRAELAWLYGHMGNPAQGIALCQDAQERSREILPDWFKYPTAILAKLHLMQNDVAAAEAALAQVTEPLDYEQVNLAVVWYGMAQTELALHQQNFELAHQTIDPLLKQMRRLKVLAFLHMGLYLKGLILLNQQQISAAHTILTEARDLAQPQPNPHSLWLIAQALGQIAAQQNDAAGALAWQQEARQHVETIAGQAPPELREKFLALPHVHHILSTQRPHQ